MKELERVRAERDVYKVRLQTLGDNPDQALKEHKSKSKQSLKTSQSGLRADEQAFATNARPNLTKPPFDDSGQCNALFMIPRNDCSSSFGRVS
jgi:hypothetical protein